MSTAAVEAPGAASVDETIRRTVRALRSAYEVDAPALGKYLGVSRGTIYSRLNGATPWLAAEIAGLAHFFGCEIVDFYTGNVRIEAGDNAPAQRGVTRPYHNGSDALIIPFPQVRGDLHGPNGVQVDAHSDAVTQMAQLTACR